MIRQALIAIVLASAAAAPAAAAAESVRPLNDTSPLRSERLSDEFRLSRYAHTNKLAKVRKAPRATASVVGRLRYQTEDELPEVYLVLRSAVGADGETWLKIRLPARPNGQTGWVPREALSRLYAVRTHLRINRQTLKATLFRDGRIVWQSPVGVGKAGTPTPRGRFWIRERLKALGGIYGPWAFGTSAYSVLSDWPGGGVVGIHGTNQPELIPGRPSHGCVRVPNHKIRQLVRLMPIGTPVQIV